jgi:hypothetical protein
MSYLSPLQNGLYDVFNDTWHKHEAMQQQHRIAQEMAYRQALGMHPSSYEEAAERDAAKKLEKERRTQEKQTQSRKLLLLENA